MSLPSVFARRYLSSKKSHSVINIITRVSAFAVGVPVAAMVVMLSVFNGLEGLVKGMYDEFDPDIVILPAEGKTFGREELPREKILTIDGVAEVSAVIEDNALLEYRGRQSVATVRGVDSLYSRIVPMEEMTSNGEYKIWLGDIRQAVVGQGIAYSLGLRLALPSQLTIIAPRRTGSFGAVLPLDAFRMEGIFPAGIFTLGAETDGKYVIVPIEFAEEVFELDGRLSSLMIRVAEGRDHEKVRSAVAQQAGEDFRVLTRYQQKASLYKIMSYEKWGIFLISFMVLVIASFSLIGSLVMLILEKRGDLRTLSSMGAPTSMCRRIFEHEGMLISCIGGVCGIAFGLLLCWIQSQFGILKLPGQSFLVPHYPVEVKLSDLAIVTAVFVAVNYIITKFTVARMISRKDIRL